MFYASFRVFYWYPGVEIICYFLPLIVASLFFLFILILIEFYKKYKARYIVTNFIINRIVN